MSKFAFLFTGQGAQAVGMLNGFAGNPVVEQTVAEASEALGLDLGKLIAEGPKEDLDLTTNTQPVMLTAAVAVYRAWIAAGGPVPNVVAGHSLGEYSALVAAGVIDFKDAVPLVRFRAQSMQDAVPVGQGGMAVILGLSAEDVKAVCAEAAQGEVVEAVNFNEPTQIVIAGHTAAVERACEIAKAKGAKRAMKLAVSAPFHSSLLKPASDRLRDYMDKLVFKGAADRLDQQRRRGYPERSGRHQGCPGAPGRRPGALGRDHAEDGGGRRHPGDRMRAEQDPDRHGQAHRSGAGRRSAGGPGGARACARARQSLINKEGTA
jgi:[acyl-carrier-protein] S-malonyltransferase